MTNHHLAMSMMHQAQALNSLSKAMERYAKSGGIPKDKLNEVSKSLRKCALFSDEISMMIEEKAG